MYEPQPTPRKISALSEKTIRAVACGHNHTLALDTEQAAYTWGDPYSLRQSRRRSVMSAVKAMLEGYALPPISAPVYTLLVWGHYIAMSNPRRSPGNFFQGT